MALFGSIRDAGFITGINRELIVDIIDTEVAYYKIVEDKNTVNIYGETEDGLLAYSPVLIPCLITREDQNYNEEDHGQDFTQEINFAFLRDLLVEKNIFPQVGDIVEYNNEYWEIDTFINNQYFVGKNPELSYAGPNFGMDISISLKAHLTRKSRISGIVKWDYNTGNNNL